MWGNLPSAYGHLTGESNFNCIGTKALLDGFKRKLHPIFHFLTFSSHIHMIFPLPFCWHDLHRGRNSHFCERYEILNCVIWALSTWQMGMKRPIKAISTATKFPWSDPLIKWSWFPASGALVLLVLLKWVFENFPEVRMVCCTGGD